VDADTGKVVSAKSVKLFPDLLACRATFIEPPRLEAELPPVRITLPGDTSVMSDARDANVVLSRFFRRNVRLARVAPEDFTIDQYHPDIEDIDPAGHQDAVVEQKLGSALFASAGLPSPVPIGSFLDVFPLSVLSTSTLARLTTLRPHAVNEPYLYSTLRTSISPNIVKGGYLRNVIPSEAEATLDIRALPDEDVPAFLERLRAVIDDPAIEVARGPAGATRPGSPPSRLDTEAFKALVDANRRVYDIPTVPTMLTGGTDMAQVRARGVQCYGIGPISDTEDGPRGFGAHSDQERILEEGLHKFVRFHWDVVVSLAKAR
jgi:acetylornithine deacetylase/succinyl-diaminopimelate desuccinylase-like protein